MIDISDVLVPAITWLLVPAVALASALLVRLGVAYARAAGIIDQPGRRRSHVVPTPRGGGIGIVVGVLGGIACMALWQPALIDASLAAALLIGTGVVAAVGWYDDHRSLGVVPRLLAHALVAALLVFVLFRGAIHPAWTAAIAVSAPVFWLAAVTATVASINAHNFMDGIDGLLALQAIFVFVTAAACGWLVGTPAFALACAIAAAAVVGFVPFNIPRARAFMGDVGSGALGFLIAALLLAGMLRGILSPCIALLLPSAFVSAHREHLYQWLVRGGRSHVAVTGLYMTWNLVVVVPAVIVSTRVGVPVRYMLCALVYAFGLLVWSRARTRCLHAAHLRGKRLQGADHAAA